jgi:hypothetical protein
MFQALAILRTLGGLVWGFLKPLVVDWQRTLPTALLVGLAAFSLGKCEGTKAERSRTAIAAAEAETRVIQRDAASKVVAARERTADALITSAAEQEQANAVKDLPPSSTTARQRGRACVVLRRQDAEAGRVPRPC